MDKNKNNTWLQIPAEDYEGHMSDANVGQLQAINEIFCDTIKKYSPGSLCVLGCATGNGFEHINPSITKIVAGIDVNDNYLKILNERFGQNIPGLELICGDLNDIDLSEKSFEFIFAALIFEYVDVEKVLKNISYWLKKDGILAVVLQLQSESSSSVSETKYHSLKKLSPVINLVHPNEFLATAVKAGLKEIFSYEYDLKTGKKFFVVLLSGIIL